MIYLDHSATTPVDPRVRDAMLPYFTELFGNPSSLHRYGQHALAAVDDARQTVADILGAHVREIVFTGNGTEANNLALRGVALGNRTRGNHIITTPIEHHAILRTCEQLEREFGFEITYVPVNRHGVVNPDDVARAITDRTILISVMYANNEIGAVEPIAEIGKLARARGIYFHTDAVQAGGYLNVDVNALNVDMMSLGSHKFHGPKGVGVLYLRNGVKILPTQTGGNQERGRRAGTENVPYLVGFAKALEIAQSERDTHNAKLRENRARLVDGLLEAIPGAELTGHPTERLPGHSSFVIPGAVGDEMVFALDLAGVAVSTGSACTAGSPEPSHVLAAMGYAPELARGALRITLGRENTDAEIDAALRLIPQTIARIRQSASQHSGT
ncbi:MAG: cysteine desulfurase [Chloroflexi bacterium]|nr:cysteine desulfurase [Chloroflexota bacterium]